MKKNFVFLWAILFLFGVFRMADATLWDRGGGLIYDDVLNITWLQDANYVNTTGYDDLLYGYDTGGQIRGEDALIWAENLEYFDTVRNVTYRDWRLPKTLPVNGFAYNYSVKHDGSSDHGCNISALGSVFQGSTSSEMAYMFYNNLEGLGWFDLNGVGREQYGLDDTGPFVNLQESLYFSGTAYDPTPNGLWTFSFQNGYQQHDYLNDQDNRYAWAVRDGDVIPHNHCVGTASELQAALDEAAHNSTDDVIQVRQGTYYGNFSYITDEDNSLSMKAGYNEDCTEIVVGPANTVLDAQNS